MVADDGLGRLRGSGREGLARTSTIDRGDVRRGVWRGVAGAWSTCVPALGSAAAHSRASTTSNSCCRATCRPSRCSKRSVPCFGAGWQSGKFMYVDTDLKIDLPEARVVLDRERLADLGLDLAGVGRELGTLLGGAYVNRFNYFDRSYKVIPQIGDKDRATVDPLLDLKIKTPGGQLVPVSTFTHIETSTAPRTLNRFQQRNAVRVFGGVIPGVHQGRRAACA